MNYGDFSNPKGGYSEGNTGNGYLSGDKSDEAQTESRKEALVKLLKILIKTALSKTTKNTTIPERIAFVRTAFDNAKSFVPKHPAVDIVENFIYGKPKKLEINISDEKVSSVRELMLLYGLRAMPEVARIIEDFHLIFAGQGQLSHDFTRELSSESESDFVEGFVSDLYANPTRALLGSFNGSATSSTDENNVILIFKIKNRLSWTSLTRYPPSLGGYELGSSLIPNIEGWYVDMNFEFRQVIPF